MSKKKSFILFVDRKKEISMLSDDQAGKLFKAVFEYADSETETEFEELALSLMFSVFKSQIDSNAEKYAEKAERNRKYYQSKKANSENSVKFSQIQKVQSNSAYDTDTVTDTDTDTDTDTEIIIYDNYNNRESVCVASATPSDTFKTQETQNKTQKTQNKTQTEVKHKFGEYQHVRLTDKQYQSLIADYGETTIKEFISKIDEWIQMKGKSPYKDYNLAIRKWLGKDNIPKKGEVIHGNFDERFGKFA